MVEGQPAGQKPKKTYPMKPVTFPTDEKRQEATRYCDAVGIGFSHLMRKLLAAHMREHPAPQEEPLDAGQGADA